MNNPIQSSLTISAIIDENNTPHAEAFTSELPGSDNLDRLLQSTLSCIISELLQIYDTASLSRLLLQSMIQSLQQSDPSQADILRNIRAKAAQQPVNPFPTLHK